MFEDVISHFFSILEGSLNTGSGSLLFTHPGSRIQRSKRHRIPDPDPQHCPELYVDRVHVFFTHTAVEIFRTQGVIGTGISYTTIYRNKTIGGTVCILMPQIPYHATQTIVSQLRYYTLV
jgi:hypothetical protein